MHTNFFLIHILFFVSKIIRKCKMPCALCRCFNDKYHEYVMYKLLPILNLSYKITYRKNIYNNLMCTDVIWVFWWQGYSNMPPIVNSCIKSIKKHSKLYKLIFIDKNNIKKYTNIPKYIFTKLNENKITITHFSDILRFNLLSNYGGLWIDSTIYCTSDIKSINDLYTIKGPLDKCHFFVSLNRWTSFLIGGNKNNLLFLFMNNFYKLYWKRNNTIIDYFMMDYALTYAYNRNIGDFKTYSNKEGYKNNPHLYCLANLLNRNYNNKVYNYITKDTNLFKLTYKMKFKQGNTFYRKIINDNK